ncbi:MAG: hypothetical protein ACXVWW_00815 [Nocardioides sp.]
MLARIRAARLVPTAVGVLVAITVTLTWVTVLHPVLEHDDWDMLLPDGSPSCSITPPGCCTRVAG